MKNGKLKIIALASLYAFIFDGLAGTFKHITVDGSFADWADVPLAYSQAQDATNVVAYQKIYVANGASGVFSNANPL